MVKAEVKKILEELRIHQREQDKFVALYSDFTSVPRCKKGVLAFIKELSDQSKNPSIDIFGKERNELSIVLTSGKSYSNSELARKALDKSLFLTTHSKELRKERKELLKALCEYIRWVHKELDQSTLTDRKERQVYLRRAFARLTHVLSWNLVVPLTVEQWSTVEPAQGVEYLTEDLETLLSSIEIERDDPIWPWFGWYNLNTPNTLESIETYLDYLDSFLVY